MRIKISDIDLETSVDVRSNRSPDIIKDYTEHLQTGGTMPMPPVIVFGPDSRGKYFLSEGWHRLEAHKRAGKDKIEATIKPGGWVDAQDFATSKHRSNIRHGWRETREQRRRVVELTLKRHPEWTNLKVAEHCGVSRDLIINVRNSMCRVSTKLDTLNSAEQERKVVRKDGKTYTLPPPPKSPPPSEPPHSEEVTTSGKPPSPDVQGLENGPPGIPPPEPPPLPLDRLDRTVPPHLVPLWERRKEVQALLDDLSRIQRVVQQAQDDRDPLYFGAGQGNTPVSFSSALGHLKQARSSIKEAMPYAVCPMCQGTGCRNCSGNGLISQFRYNTIIPAAKKVKR